MCFRVQYIEYNQTEDICQCFTPLKLIVLCEGMLQLWSKFYSFATAGFTGHDEKSHIVS